MKFTSQNPHPVLSSHPFVRLKALVKARFNKRLDVRFMISVTDADGAFTARLVNNNLIVPLTSGGKFLALAEIPSGGNLSVQDQDCLSDMIRMVLEPQIYSWFLQQEASNLQTTVQDKLKKLAAVEAADEFAPDYTSAFLILQSKQKDLIQRTAITIHDLSKRWALVNLKDVSISLQTAEDFISLGEITLLIDGFSELSDVQISALTAFLKYCGNKIGPLILIGDQQNAVPKQFAAFRMEIDRLPHEFRLRNEALELFLAPMDTSYQT